MSARRLFEPPIEDSPFPTSDELTYEEKLQADEATLRARGHTSDFCGAWIGLWAHIAKEYGVALEAESERMGARKKVPEPGESCERILEKARSAYMAIMSLGIIADKKRSKLRRFKASGFCLEATRRGESCDLKKMPKDEADRIHRNYSRYWRESWRYVHMVQRVTHLPFVEREARAFADNSRAREAAHYVDRITDLLGRIIAEKNNARGPRIPRFERAIGRALERFRRECEHECTDGQKCGRPHLFAPEWTPGQEEAKENSEPKAESKPRAKVISFSKAKEKILAGVEIAQARGEAGRLTPEEAEELIKLYAPVVQMAVRVRESANGSVEPLADFDAEILEDGEPEKPEFMPRTQNENCEFTEENCNSAESYADKFIRIDHSQPDPSEVILDDFLAAFFPDQYEEINLRAFAPRGAPDEPRFAPRTWRTCREALVCDEKLLAELREANRTRGIYFVVNSGGNKADDITRINAFFAEMDDCMLSEQHARFDASPLSPPVRNETLKSVHGFYLAAPGVAPEEFDEIQRRQIHYFKSDKKIKDRSRVMRLPFFNHVSYNGGLLSYKPVTIDRFDPNRRFTAAEMLAAFPAVPDEKPRYTPRPATLDELSSDFGAWKRELGQRITLHSTARRNSKGVWDCQGICHNGKGPTGLFYNAAQNFIYCNAEPTCDLNKIASAFGMPAYFEMAVGGAA